ncbi:hypothetical protein [Streptomyces sp. NRRL S-340]|uniref:hypothetical protein n=1 Tax=Streptomyces sp. NRRL S-340 TaxID=1463901 RepID=UPI00131E87F0|nr:hypothetical protein [Streptomyces sp. NRRL S-340]
MDLATELRRLIKSLSREDGVFGRAFTVSDGSVPELVREVALEAERTWKQYAVPGATGPDTVSEIDRAISLAGREQAVKLMAYLAAEDLVFPGSPRRDRAHAHRTAERVAHLLGHRSVWHTNIDGLSPGVRGWSPVTRHTFDGVVAGTGEGFTVVLLQVGED